ncbi:MAG: VWA domain-containing protein [Aestuariivirga sp.]
MLNFRNSLLAVVIFFLALVPARADEGARVILVLDASGSMRAKIDGKTKMEIAKEVVATVLSTWKPEDELGLVAYGHRQKGSCDDIEVLRQPGVLDRDDYMSAVDGLNPKGKTPMTAAVKLAAEALQYTEKKATVILVSDGIETCDPNPCAVAEELEKLGVELTVHTVGFGLDDKGAVAQLKCLAEKTGGTFTTAENASELQEALKKTVEAPPPAATFNVMGHVRMAANVELAKPYLQPSWVINKAPAADGTEGAYVSTEYDADMKTNLEPGDYVATITSHYSKVKVPFTVEAGKIAKPDASLEAGIVKFSGKLDENTELTDEGASWEIQTPEGDGLGTEYGAKQAFMLNAGAYKVKLRLGETSVLADVAVVAGETHEQVVTLGAGKLALSAVFAEGGPAMDKGMSFEVRKPGATGEAATWIATMYDSKSIFNLPAGTYQAIVKLGLAETQQDVEVKSGSLNEVTINANAGFLATTVAGATSYEVLAGKKDLDGSNKWLTTTYDPALNIAAHAGSYLVRAFKGDVLAGEKLVDVKAGERTEVTIP